MPRKHLIASQNNKKQQDNAKIWMKLAKEIRAAAKTGGPNSDANPRVKAAVEKALQNNKNQAEDQMYHLLPSSWADWVFQFSFWLSWSLWAYRRAILHLHSTYQLSQPLP